MIYVDIFLCAFALLGLIIGLIGNRYKRLLDLIILVAICAVLYFCFYEYAKMWVRFDALQYLYDKGILNQIAFEYEGVTFHVDTVEDIFILMQNFGFNPSSAIATCDGFVGLVTVLLGFSISLIAAPIISFILYWVLFRWICPKFLRKGIVARLLGGAVGIVEYTVMAILFLTLSGSLVGAISGSIIPALSDETSDFYKLLVNNNILTPEAISQISNYLKIAVEAANPLNTDSQIARPIFEQLDHMGLSPFNIVSRSIIIDGEKTMIPFKDDFSDFCDFVVNEGSQKINALMSGTK